MHSIPLRTTLVEARDTLCLFLILWNFLPLLVRRSNIHIFLFHSSVKPIGICARLYFICAPQRKKCFHFRLTNRQLKIFNAKKQFFFSLNVAACTYVHLHAEIACVLLFFLFSFFSIVVIFQCTCVVAVVVASLSVYIQRSGHSIVLNAKLHHSRHLTRWV